MMTYGNDSGSYDASDLFLAAVMNQQIHENLLDKVDLRAVCTYYGNMAGRGSAALQVAGVTYGAMGAANTDETTAVSATDLATTASTITVARQAIRYSVSDLYRLVGAPEGMEAMGLASRISLAASLRATDMISTLFSSVSASVGTSGVDLTVDDIYSAQQTLIQAGVPGPYVAVLAPIQISDFISDLRGEGGAQVYNPRTLEALAAYGQGVFEWNGITFVPCDSVPTSGGNRYGCMFGLGAFGYAEMVPNELLASPYGFMSVVPEGGSVYVAFERKEAEGLTDIVGNYFFGCGIIENARACAIVTDA